MGWIFREVSNVLSSITPSEISPSWSRWSVTVPSFATWKAEDLWRFSHHFRCLWACDGRSLSHAPGESYPPSVNALFQPGVFQFQCEPPESTPVEPMRPGNWKLERRHIEDILKTASNLCILISNLVISVSLVSSSSICPVAGREVSEPVAQKPQVQNLDITHMRTHW